MTGSVRLLQDITKLDQYAFSTDKRKLQITKKMSLAEMAPIEFERFKQSGILNFSTTMKMFDRDFPGHYLRLIKGVKVDVIGLLPSVQGINATLTASGVSRTVIGGDIYQEITIRRDPELITLTSGQNNTGMFEMQQAENKFLKPFEAMGVDTLWEFRMEKASNFFNYNGLADIIMTIDYEALNSFDYKVKVISELDKTYSATQAYSFRRNFSDAWYDLINYLETSNSATSVSVEFNTFFDDVPQNIYNPRVAQIAMYFVRNRNTIIEPTVNLSFRHYFEETWVYKPGEDGGEAVAKDGLISTRKGNASTWIGILESPVEGTWRLTINDLDTLRMIREGRLDDILFSMTYKGDIAPFNI